MDVDGTNREAILVDRVCLLRATARFLPALEVTVEVKQPPPLNGVSPTVAALAMALEATKPRPSSNKVLLSNSTRNIRTNLDSV